MNPPLKVLAACALLVGGATSANEPSLKSCRQISNIAERLACYDGLPLDLPARTSTVVPRQTTVAPPGAAETPVAAAALTQFGFEDRDRPDLPTAMDSTIAGRFEGWEPRDRIKLANGQVWQVVDDSRGALYKTDPKARVRRGAFGTFYLDIEGTRASPRVVRVQ